jgi:hypothetical protein
VAFISIDVPLGNRCICVLILSFKYSVRGVLSNNNLVQYKMHIFPPRIAPTNIWLRKSLFKYYSPPLLSRRPDQYLHVALCFHFHNSSLSSISYALSISNAFLILNYKLLSFSNYNLPSSNYNQPTWAAFANIILPWDNMFASPSCIKAWLGMLFGRATILLNCWQP